MVQSGAIYGVDAFAVEIEANAAHGEIGFVVIVGLPDVAVKESKDRVWTALVNSGFASPPGRTTINLAPASMSLLSVLTFQACCTSSKRNAKAPCGFGGSRCSLCTTSSGLSVFDPELLQIRQRLVITLESKCNCRIPRRSGFSSGIKGSTIDEFSCIWSKRFNQRFNANRIYQATFATEA